MQDAQITSWCYAYAYEYVYEYSDKTGKKGHTESKIGYSTNLNKVQMLLMILLVIQLMKTLHEWSQAIKEAKSWYKA